MFPHRLSQLQANDRIGYEESKELCPDNKGMHFGQLKLLMSELWFLNKCAEDGDLVLYVGAASGYHITKLAEMYSTLHFDLWDPGKFDLTVRDNMTIHNRFFTDRDAKIYAKSQRRLLFMCDIRNLAFRHSVREDNAAGDAIVMTDMNSQMRWAQIMKPAFSYLKFRLPYATETVSYLTGTIYFQPYAPLSTEARLLTNDYTTVKKYNSQEFDEKMAWHNSHNRCADMSWPKWDDLCKRFRIRNIWDNIYSLVILKIYLKRMNRYDDPDAVGELFTEIIEFHRRKSGNRYMTVYY